MRIIPALLRCTAYYLAFTEQALNPPDEALLSHKLFCQGQGGEEDFAQQNSHMRPQTYGLVPSCQKGISHCLHLSKEVYVVLSPFARQTHLSNVNVSHSTMTGRGGGGKHRKETKPSSLGFCSKLFLPQHCFVQNSQKTEIRMPSDLRCLNIIFLLSLIFPPPLSVPFLPSFFYPSLLSSLPPFHCFLNSVS